MHVVVIGGGIVGMASAYYLRQAGIDVTVLEQGRIGHGSTPRAGGGIREQYSSAISIGLSRESIKIWTAFEDHFNVDIEYRRNGYLYLARTDETVKALKQAVDFHADHDVGSEFIHPDQLTEICSGIRADRYAGATYCGTDGYADPERALQGFALGAARNGADIRLGRRVTDVCTNGDRVTGVRTEQTTFDADAVVNAAGAWAGKVSALAGIDLNIWPERRQLAVVEPERAMTGDEPFVTDLDSGSYFRPEPSEVAYVGGHFAETEQADPDTYRREHDPGWADLALAEAADVATYFGSESRIRQGWAGLYAMTADHHPIIEEVTPGFIVASGFSGHGFMQSPATGQLVTELVQDGEGSLLDISGLTNDRFENGEEFSETFYSA